MLINITQIIPIILFVDFMEVILNCNFIEQIAKTQKTYLCIAYLCFRTARIHLSATKSTGVLNIYKRIQLRFQLFRLKKIKFLVQPSQSSLFSVPFELTPDHNINQVKCNIAMWNNLIFIMFMLLTQTVLLQAIIWQLLFIGNVIK